MKKQILKICLLGLGAFFCLLLAPSVSASEIDGNLNTANCSTVSYSAWGPCTGEVQNRTLASSTPSGCALTTAQEAAMEQACKVDTGLGVETQNCAAVTNGTVAYDYPTCTLTCNSGYDKSGNTCVVHHTSSSSSGGGGGSVTTYCTAVTFSAWQSTCFNGIQYRNTATQTPTGCSLTSAQIAEQQRACTAEATSTPPVVPPVTPPVTLPVTLPASSGTTVLQNIATEAAIMDSNNRGTLLAHLGIGANFAAEQAGLVKYKTILGLDKNISAADKTMLDYFIVYGTLTTHRLGAGERAAVLNSYYQAYGRLPNSVTEWSDVLKIASGRWPSERSATAEAQAKVEFKKVYKRNAVMTNNIDENAIMVIAYGLLPLNRNLNSEKVAIKTFVYVYGHNPVNALAWNIVRAIAYSGATR